MYFKQNEQANEQADEQPNEQPNTQPGEHINKQNKTTLNDTTLNLFFNYISDNDAEFEGISQSQKQGIILILKKLEIYIEKQEHIKSIPKEMIQDTKIQYWVVKEMYFSSYAVYLSELDKKAFAFCYLQAKKYMADKTKEDIISYFIKCLQKEIKKDEV